jgi:hypothetical protein
MTDPSSHQRGRYNLTNSNCLQENLEEIEKLVAGPRWAPDTRRTGRLTVGRNVALTLTLTLTHASYYSNTEPKKVLKYQ